ncbi:RNA-binding protein 4B-like isoform X1 [Limulus polyphemus]|uniref:RNA-binding protein 4B-like isoform X1 n=2 Tax=Limulus polyphemus TaxID=6850 RepID=A0ABM1B0T0_LIMPO|nr:RNA-binding protein 4B-like isoform X1 [Limulus polyphemus]
MAPVKKSSKLYIGNLPETCSNDDLHTLFSKYGEIEECDVVKNYGFVHMASEDVANTAIQELNNSEFMGKKITVELSHSKVRQKAGMGGKGTCYRCGRAGHWSKECPRNPNARYGRLPPPMSTYGTYPERTFGRYGPESRYDRFSDGYGFDRFSERSFAAERMRPYPDPYERRLPPPPPSATTSRADDLYYRRPYDDYGFDYPPVDRGYDRYTSFAEDRYTSGRLTPPTAARRAAMF